MSRILETDDSGSLTIPPDVLGASSPRARYVVTSDSGGIHIQTESVSHTGLLDEAAGDRGKLSVRSERWKALAQEIGLKWDTDKTAAEVVSEMRR